MRRLKRLQWTLAQSLMAITVVACLLAFARAVASQPGGPEALSVIVTITLCLLFCILPIWITWLAEAAFAGRRAVHVADGILWSIVFIATGCPLLLGFPFVALALIVMLAIVWLVPLYFYSNWRDDMLSTQLETLRKIKAARQDAADRFFQQRREGL